MVPAIPWTDTLVGTHHTLRIYCRADLFPLAEPHSEKKREFSSAYSNQSSQGFKGHLQFKIFLPLVTVNVPQLVRPGIWISGSEKMVLGSMLLGSI